MTVWPGPGMAVFCVALRSVCFVPRQAFMNKSSIGFLLGPGCLCLHSLPPAVGAQDACAVPPDGTCLEVPWLCSDDRRAVIPRT